MTRLELEVKHRIDKRKPEWNTFEWIPEGTQNPTGWKQDSYWFMLRLGLQERGLSDVPQRSSDITESSVSIRTLQRGAIGQIFPRL